jgi:polar amino acid transport system permease protein
MTWDWEFVRDIVPQLLEGLKLTIYATVAASAFSIILGLLWAICRRTSLTIPRVAVGAFTEFIRRTPILVQLYFIFLVLPSMGITLSPLLAGILGLGLHYSTYTAEIYRAGINSIGTGQWEAALALDMPRTRIWSRVILPQAVPRVIPPLGNTVIAMFKETALLSAITVQEVIGVARDIGTTTYVYTEPLIVASVMYLVLSYGASLVIRGVERLLAAPSVGSTKALKVESLPHDRVS